MPTTVEYWDSKSNIEAETGLPGVPGAGRPVDISDSFNTPGDDGLVTATGDTEAEPDERGEENAFPMTESQLMNLVRQAFHQGSEHQRTNLQSRWMQAYRAYNNQHASDSKYLSARFRGRSHLYRPKTRSTVRRKMAEAAAALFSTKDVITTVAGDEEDPIQAANAAIIRELLRYRLDRGSENAAIPWFRISMGAHQCSQLTGICISKQYWEYRRIYEGEEPLTIGELAPNAPPQFAGLKLPPEMGSKPKYRVVKDRPRIMLFPPEDVIRDPGAAWEDQAQESSYLILRHPMSVDAALTFLSDQNEKSNMKFHPVTQAQLLQAAGQKSSDKNNSDSVRRAREQSGNDRYNDQTIASAYQQVWLHENFFRIEGSDYVFWTLDEAILISDVVPVEEAYPEQGGNRPVVIGVGALEPFKIDPMGAVESWAPIQSELNDLVNLRLDAVKQTIAPLAKVKRGRSVDLRALQNRSPDSVVYMQNTDDVEFDRPGDVSQASFLEMEKLNADFDEQAGSFSVGSVQTNRQLNETVGGMKLMNSSANALGEFDLRVWVETWVEPVLRQIVKLEQYYETDQTILTISAKRAKLFKKFKIDQVTDELLTQQCAISVDVGLGSSDPMMSLEKFAKASQLVGGFLGENIRSDLKRDAVIDEVYGKAGYRDAAARFFQPSIEEDQRLQEAEQVIMQLQAALEEAQKSLEDKQAEIDGRVDVARITQLGGLAKQEMAAEAAARQAFQQAAYGVVTGDEDRAFQREQGAVTHQRNMEGQNAKAQQARTLERDRMAGKAATRPPAQPGGGQAAGQGKADGDAIAQALMQGFQMIAQQLAGLNRQ